MAAQTPHAEGAPDFDPEILCEGTGIGDVVVAYAKRKVNAAARAAPAPVRFGRIKIKREHNPAIERPIVVAATLDVDGHLIRAHAAGHTATEAVDRLEERLRRQLVDVRQRTTFQRRRHTGVANPGEWRHGDVDVEPLHKESEDGGDL